MRPPWRLVLYGEKYWFSPFVFSVFVALTEKELPFEARTFDLFKAKDHLDPEFQRASIVGTVPTLVHDGFWLTESSAIVEYIEDAFSSGPRLLPTDPKERARARQVMAFLRTGLEALREERPTHTMFYRPNDATLTPSAKRCVEKLIKVADALVSSGRSLGAEWSIADAELAFMLHRLILNGDPMPQVLVEYARAQWNRASVQSFVSHARPVQYSV